MRIQRLPAERAFRRPRRELRHVHLREHDCAGRAQLLHEKGVFGRNRPFEQDRAASRRQVGGVVVVLEDNRDAVQRRARTLRFSLGIERARGLERLRIERQHRAQRRPLPVVRVDARQTELHQSFCRQRTGVERAVDVGDSERVEIDRACGR